jgi:hypothetical protein
MIRASFLRVIQLRAIALRSGCAALLVVLALVMPGGDAHASGVYGTVYSLTGANCVPVDTDVQNGTYETAGFGVRYQLGWTGSIRLICNISETIGHWRQFSLSDVDAFAGYSIVVELKSAHDYYATSTTIATCTSNYPSGVKVRVCDFPDFTPSPLRYYWFEVTINRPGFYTTPEFLSIFIDGEP